MLRSDGSVIGISLLLAAVTAVPVRGQTLTFEQVAAERRPHPQELDTDALLTDAARAAVGGRSFALEAPTASIKAGPRRAEGDHESDVELEVELPLLADRAGRAELGARIGDARDVLQRAGRAFALADLAAAYAGAWLAQAQVELRAQDLDLTRAWLAAAELRVEAGADPPYESILVSGEHDRALLELLQARREVELAWGELARLADVGGAARPLDLASLPSGQEPGSPASSATGGVALAGIETRRDLTILIARANRMAASSRWAVAGDVGREGEEEIAHLGLAYRFPLGGERAAMEGELRALESSAIAAATADASSLRARVAAARVALASTSLSLGADDFDRAVQALDSRVTEGKERASQVLPLRRQLLEAALAGAASRAARAQAAAELYFLDGGDSP